MFGTAFRRPSVEARWGGGEAWEQSQSRAKGYTKEQWQQIKQETDEINRRYVELMRAGVPAHSTEAMNVAEEARLQICRWLYACPPEMHAGIAEMYVADPRHTQTYETFASGLAQYARDVVVANAAART